MKKVGFKSVVSDYLTFFKQPHRNNCGQTKNKRFFLFLLTQTNIHVSDTCQLPVYDRCGDSTSVCCTS